VTYLRYDASSLLSNVGIDGPNGSRLSDGRSGHISYGPFFDAQAGKYTAGFYIRRIGPPVEQTFQFDIFAGSEHMLAERSVRHSELFEDIPALIYLDFELAEPTARLEARLYIAENLNIEIQSLVIFSSPARSWGNH
jgi:hypothetical protein